MLKTTSFLTFFFALFSTFTLTSCEKEKVLANDAIPSEIKSYTSLHFPENEIVRVTRVYDDLRREYEVYLTASFYLEFNNRKEVICIEGVSPIPSTVLSIPVSNYLEDHYSGLTPMQWKLEDNHQEVKLSNDLIIEFDKSGNFLRESN